MLKLDIGSGPKDHWYSEDPEWVHLDCEGYEGVVKWECPERLPVDDTSVDEVYIGQLLIEIHPKTQLELAKELVRVMKEKGVIKVHCYNGIVNFPEFFSFLRRKGWHVEKDELVNRYVDDGTVMETYLIELRRVPGENLDVDKDNTDQVVV